MDWIDKSILIVGKGKSGRAAYRRLAQLGAKPVFYDDNDFAVGERQYTFSQVQSASFDCALLSPAVKPNHPLLPLLCEKGVPLISELDLGYLLFGGKIIAITGTNGKTTTVRQTEALLSGAGLRARAVGNIGIPFCDVVAPLDWAVVEVSSFQCYQSALFSPNLAAVTNIAPDHLEWHGNLHDYRMSKLKLLETAKGYALNVDDPDLPRLDDKPCYPYSMQDDSATAFVDNLQVKVRDKGSVYTVAKVEELPLRGNHNLYNVMCALALTVAAVGYHPTFADSVRSFKGERMRTEQLTFARPYVFNDSKGTNTAATMAAMRQMVGDTALMLGGWDKGEDFRRLFMQLPAGVALVTFGQAGVRIYREAVAFGLRDVSYAPHLPEAVRLAFGKDKDNVLFSPACSSFDDYASYVERGLAFEKEIRQYL
jgi:UDP-N-acetylmuramoylalanine--D-glutamate ligase